MAHDEGPHLNPMTGHSHKPRILWQTAEVIPDTGALRVEVDGAYEEWLEELQVALAIRYNETQADGLGPIACDGRNIVVRNVRGREKAARAQLDRLVAAAHTTAQANIERFG
jgi:hypothetical protein